MNRLVEEELDEFRKEIEAKFVKAPTKTYSFPRSYTDETYDKYTPLGNHLGSIINSRVTLDGVNDQEVEDFGCA